MKEYFIVGLVVGILLTVALVLSLPLAFEDAGHRQQVRRLIKSDKIIIVIGCDEKMEHLNSTISMIGCTGMEKNGNQYDEWVVKSYKNKADADKIKQHILLMLGVKKCPN